MTQSLQRHNVAKKIYMYKRATVYFFPDIHKALRLRAAETGSSISQLVNEALRQSLSDDAADFDAFLLHEGEQNVSFENFICDLRRHGRI
jgi:plasmid stability protein